MLIISSRMRASLPFLPQTLTSRFQIPIGPLQRTPSASSFSTPSSPFLHSSPLLQRREDAPAENKYNRRLLVVQPRLRPQLVLQAKLNEALSLANSLEKQADGLFGTELWEKELPPHVVVQNPIARSRHAGTYFGPGTVDMIKCQLNAAESEGGVRAVFVNTILTGIQQRNLERVWVKPVLDRVGVIIEIFSAHAFTKEAKLQAELASLMYKRTRLVRVRGPDGRYTFGAIGEAEVVSARGRGSGGRGIIGGAGETELQLQRRRIVDRRKQLLDDIEEVRRTRALQRASRKRHGGNNGLCMATVAVVGYTNAGKSTLVSALSGTHLYSDDRLFATVDPKLRSVVLPSGRKVLVSDTVGFISDLPVLLVEAFHATLEEVVEADLLVHVLDSSAPNIDEHRETVLRVLKQIGVSEEKLQNMIEVWNKQIDLQEKIGADECRDDDVSSFDDGGNDEWLSEDEQNTSSEIPSDQKSIMCEDLRNIEESCHCEMQCIPHVKTSAVTGVGLKQLLELVDDKLESRNNVTESNVIDRKWRPRPTEDSGITVEEKWI